MAAITSGKSGNWSATDTWVGGVVPGDGDTAIIAHTVTVDANTTVGTSPGDTTTDAITVNSAKEIVVATGVTLTCRGRLYVNNGKITMQAGSTLILDSHLSGGTHIYQLTCPTTGGYFITQGTSGSRCTIRGYDTTNRGYVAVVIFNATYYCSFDYTDFQHLGSGSANGIYVYGSGPTEFDHCTFSNCGRVIFNAYNGANSINIHDCYSDGTSAYWQLDCVAPTTGARTFERNVILERVNTSACVDLSPNLCYFRKFSTSTGNLGGSQFTNCLFASDEEYFADLAQSLVNCYLFHTAATNPHFLSARTVGADNNVIGCVFEYSGTDSNGDLIVTGSSVSPYAVNVSGCVAIPNADGTAPGSFINALNTDADINITCEHNTFMGEGGGILVGETYKGHAGLVSSVKSNICWGVSSGYIGNRANNAATPIQDIIDPSETSHNWRWNLSDGTEGRGWNSDEPSEPTMFSVATSTFDDQFVGGDPEFVDSTRNLAKWSASKGAAETSAAAIALIVADQALISDLVTWVKDGFKIQNVALKDAGHDGTTIGAMGYQKKRRIRVGMLLPI